MAVQISADSIYTRQTFSVIINEDVNCLRPGIVHRSNKADTYIPHQLSSSSVLLPRDMSEDCVAPGSTCEWGRLHVSANGGKDLAVACAA